MSKIIKEDAGEQIDSLQYILFFWWTTAFLFIDQEWKNIMWK